MGPEVRPDICPQPTTGAAAGLVCVVFFISSLGLSHFGVVSSSLLGDCSYPSRLVALFWMDSSHGCIGGDRSAGEFVGAGRELTVLARFAQPGAEAWLGQACLWENLGVGQVAGKLCREYCHDAGSGKCICI